MHEFALALEFSRGDGFAICVGPTGAASRNGVFPGCLALLVFFDQFGQIVLALTVRRRGMGLLGRGLREIATGSGIRRGRDRWGGHLWLFFFLGV